MTYYVQNAVLGVHRIFIRIPYDVWGNNRLIYGCLNKYAQSTRCTIAGQLNIDRRYPGNLQPKHDSDGLDLNQNENPEGEIVVRLDPLIRDIVPDFLQHRRENTAAISVAIDTSDFQAVGDIGHDIEGTAGAFGFVELGAIGRSLQKAARESSLEDIKSLAEELTSYLERLKIVYE